MDEGRCLVFLVFWFFGSLVLWFFGSLVARDAGAGLKDRRLSRHIEQGPAGCVEAQPQRISRAPSEPMRCATAPRILRSRAKSGFLASSPTNQHQKPEQPTNQKTKNQRTRRMRAGAAVTHQPRPPGADELRCRSTHPTKPCPSWLLSLLPHQPAAKARATN